MYSYADVDDDNDGAAKSALVTVNDARISTHETPL
jgi:hypothetical protein